MENKELENQQADDQIYDYAANLLVKENKSPSEVKKALIEEGIDEESASMIVDSLETQINKIRKDRSLRVKEQPKKYSKLQLQFPQAKVLAPPISMPSF